MHFTQRLHSCLLHSPCTACSAERRQHVGVHLTQMLHSCLLHLPCTTCSAERRQHEGVPFTQQATFRPLVLTMYYIYTVQTERKQHEGAHFTQKLHSCLSHSPCTTYTVQTTRVGLACRQTSSISLGHPSANRCHNWLCCTRSPKKSQLTSW